MNLDKRPFTIRTPATSANLGPGFDTFGLALDLYDEYHFEVSSDFSIEISGEADGATPKDESNKVLEAAIRYSELGGTEFQHRAVRQVSRIPVSRGLGSSAAATVTGLVAACQSAGLKINKPHIIEEATAIEGHPDNVIPAYTGGLTVIVNGKSGLVWTQLPFPPKLEVAVAVPNTQIETVRARSVLPDVVDHADAVFNVSRAALLVAAIYESDYSLFAEAMRDRLHQPYRSPLHPALSQMIDAAYKAGAAGAALSGSGSAIIAFKESGAQELGAAMSSACKATSIECRSFASRVCQRGLTIRHS